MQVRFSYVIVWSLTIHTNHMLLYIYCSTVYMRYAIVCMLHEHASLFVLSCSYLLNHHIICYAMPLFTKPSAIYIKEHWYMILHVDDTMTSLWCSVGTFWWRKWVHSGPDCRCSIAGNWRWVLGWCYLLFYRTRYSHMKTALILVLICRHTSH